MKVEMWNFVQTYIISPHCHIVQFSTFYI